MRENLIIVYEAKKVFLEDYIDFFSIKNYIGLDLTYKAKETSSVEYLQEAIKLVPENQIVRTEYQSFIPLPIVEQKKPEAVKSNVIPVVKKTVNSIGIKSRINKIGGQFSIIVPKGSSIPCEFSNQFCTISDNQSSMNIETFKGENRTADNNIRLGKFLINDLPLKPAGVASVTVTIIIKENLDLIVKARSNDTGNEIEANYYDREIAK